MREQKACSRLCATGFDYLEGLRNEYDNFDFMGLRNANSVMRIKTCGKQASVHFVQIPMECGLQCKEKKKRVKEQHFRNKTGPGKRPIECAACSSQLTKKVWISNSESVVYFSSVKVKGVADCMFKTVVFSPAVHMDAHTHSFPKLPSASNWTLA